MDLSINNRTPSRLDPATPQQPSAAETRQVQTRPALVVTEARPDALTGPETTEEVPDSALRRDDALGRLFAAAFTLPAPPMPAFPT